MRKYFTKLVSIFLIALLALPVIQPITAEAAPQLNDGEYAVDFKVLKDGTDNISVMDGYTEKPATLEVQDGKNYVSVTLTNSSWIKAFQVDKDGQYVDADVVSSDEEADTRVVRFEVDDLSAKLNVFTHVKIPDGVLPFPYDNKYTVQFKFDKDSITPVNVPEPGNEEPGNEEPGNEEPGNEEPGNEEPGNEEPGNEEPGNEEPGNEEPGNEDPGDDFLKDGKYTIDFKALHADRDEDSRMNAYFETPGTLSVKDGKKHIAVTLKDSSTITAFQTEQNGSFVDATVISENEADNTRVVEFRVTDLTAPLNAKVTVYVPDFNYEATHDIRLLFDPDSIVPVEDPDKEEPGNEDPDGLEDGKYSIDFKVLKNNTDEESMMNDYVVSPAVLTVQDGEKEVAFTLTNSSWITRFQTEQDGSYVDVDVLSSDTAKDTRVVGFAVDDLEQKVNAQVKVDIPDLNYHNTYEVQIAFDPDSIKPYDGDEPKGPDGNQGPGTPPPNIKDDDLDFDRNGDPKPKNNSDHHKKPVNAKTADMAQIGLYVMLLIASLVVLVKKIRTGTL